MLIVNLLNGVFLASLVCFIVGALLLAIQVGRYSGSGQTAVLPTASQTAKYQARVQTAFTDPRFRIGRTLITTGGIFAIASFVAVFVLSTSLPRCTETPDHLDEAVAMCMPVAPVAAPAA